VQSTKKRSYFVIIIVTSVAFAGAAAASITLPFAKVTSEKSEHLYVIYYGHLVDENGKVTDQATRILAAKPELVIVQHSFPDGELNLTPSVQQQFKDAGIKVLTYAWTNYGARDLNVVKADIGSQMASGVDGIFVDEVTNIKSDVEYRYYEAIDKQVKSYGQDKLVVMNPGHYKVSERIMLISDVVSLEEEWVYYGQITWMHKYPSSRFMGVSSNEYCTGCINESNAAGETAKAWDAGIGYHFTTDMYIDLPTWFDSYTSQVEQKKTKQ